MPKLPGARVVVNAANAEVVESSGTTSRVATSRWRARVTVVRRSSTRSISRAERAEALVDALVAALDLADVVDGALALGAQRGEQHRHAGADVRRFDACRRAAATGPTTSARCGSQSTMRAPMPIELVDEEQARLEHLLVDEDRALALRRRDERDRHGVGRERRPRLILELRHVAAEVALNHHLLLCRDDEIVAVDRGRRCRGARSPCSVERRCSTPASLDADLGARDRGEPDERADLDVVGADRDACAPPSGRPPWIVSVFVPMPSMLAPSATRKCAEVLHVRLAGGVAQDRRARRRRPRR